MTVDTLPEWLMPTTLSVEGLKLVIEAQIDLNEKQVSFVITASGWLTKASGKAARAICAATTLRAERLKMEKETIARMSGWRIAGDTGSNQVDEKVLLAG